MDASLGTGVAAGTMSWKTVIGPAVVVAGDAAVVDDCAMPNAASESVQNIDFIIMAVW